MIKFTLEAFERFIASHKYSIILLVLLLAVTAGGFGWRYLKYSETDPQFCATCHMMQESYENWEASHHWEIICQRCHRMSILEKNRLLVAYVATGYTQPNEQSHGQVAPWETCRDCHIDDVKQGSITLRKSYGHARHVFMENIDCIQCHSAKLHNFEFDSRACSRCHTDKLVHGLGMESLACLNCHSYGEEDSTSMVSSSRCMECHEEVERSGPMETLECFDCHKPHSKIKQKDPDCLGSCHGNESRVGQHGLHMERAGLGCLDCHRAHDWVVGEEEARTLCTKCHEYRDPQTFIY